MFKKNFKWLRHAVVCALFGLMPCALAQQKKSPASVTTGKKKEKSSTAATDKAPAQPSPPAKPSVAVPDATVKAQVGDDPATPTMPKRTSFDLKPDQEERFRKLLPKSFAKLANRERFHIVAIGDANVELGLRNPKDEELAHSTAVTFAKELGMQFYYTGGVRMVKPVTGKVKKDAAPKIPQLGPEITVRLLARSDKMMIHAMQSLTTHGIENSPDLVILSFGLNDALTSLNQGEFAKALQEVIQTVRSRGEEIVLLGPTLTVADPAEESLGLTRPYADTMREIAADSGVLFVDSGDLASYVAIAESVEEPEQIFEQVVKQYRRLFDHSDYIHTLPEIHRMIGKRMFDELIKGVEHSPWALTGGIATFQSGDKFTLGYQIKNTTDKDASFAVLPLVTRDWKPVDAAPGIALKAGETKAVEVVFARRSGATSGLPSHEPLLRLPVLVSGAGTTRIEDVRAEVRPFTLLWKLESLFNQEKSFALENLLVNTTAEPLKGTWSAEWLGQKRNGEFSLAAGEKKPLALSFDLPASSEPWRQTSPLTMEVSAAGLKLRFDRTIEISRNLGLKQAVWLTPLSEPDKAPAASTGAGVRLRIDADPNSLFLTYEINGINIEDRDAGKGAFGCQLALDARSYGKRLGFGAVDALQLYGMAADGDYPFENPQPWAFGTGYAATYDPQYIRAQFGSTGSGIRRFTVTVPRSYLYLHEWAIGNGNSQIGIRTTLAFWKGPREGAAAGDYPQSLAFSLLANGRHPDDAEGLAVLELTERPTERWTVNPF